MDYEVLFESLEELRSLEYQGMIQDTIDRNLRVEKLDRAKQLIELEIDYLTHEWDGTTLIKNYEGEKK